MASSIELLQNNGWLTEVGTDDPLKLILEDFPQQPLSTALGEDPGHCLSAESCSSYPNTVSGHSSLGITTSKTCIDLPTKQHKLTTNLKSFTAQNDSTLEPTFTFPPNMLSFGDSNIEQYYGRSVGFVKPKHENVFQRYRNLGSDVTISQGTNAKQNSLPDKETKKMSHLSRPPCPQDHVIAERKRRERLTERFIALSAIIPGLTKMDKASVLGDSIKYIKRLQDRVKTLEELTSNRSIEATIFVKKFQVTDGSDLNSTDENCTTCSDEPLPEIQARVSNKNVLIKILCDKQKGVLVKAIAEIEKLNLSIVSSSVIQFGTSTMDITIMTQMNEEFNMAVKDMVKSLRCAFVQAMSDK